jgi:hypothetical protein
MFAAEPLIFPGIHFTLTSPVTRDIWVRQNYQRDSIIDENWLCLHILKRADNKIKDVLLTSECLFFFFFFFSL